MTTSNLPVSVPPAQARAIPCRRCGGVTCGMVTCAPKPITAEQIAAMGPRPDLGGFTATLDGIEWDSEFRAEIVDPEMFREIHGEPVTHERASDIVERDEHGHFAEEMRESTEEARAENRGEMGSGEDY